MQMAPLLLHANTRRWCFFTPALLANGLFLIAPDDENAAINFSYFAA